MKVTGSKEHYKFSHILLSLFLIAFGILFGYFVINLLFHEIHAISFIGLVLLIPTLILCSVFPLYIGVSLIIDAIKDKYREDDTDA